ncbi:AMP-binding protein [Streptomyces sp. NPDC056663]|uniref:AMP-binding protein n=1 Tax=Streptomyces sp. NPDC056663 TaxID=3345899 RepID=UPI0036872BAB
MEPGDTVAGYLPNTPHAVIALLAAAAVGAVWTVCSPDFGTPSVLARLRQARPTVLLAVGGYRHGGKEHDRLPSVEEITAGLPTLRHLVAVDHLRPSSAESLWTTRDDVAQHTWSALLEQDAPLVFADVPFDHPCGSCGPRAPPGCPRGSCRATGASSSSCSRRSVWAPPCAPTTATSSTPRPAGWSGTSWSRA